MIPKIGQKSTPPPPPPSGQTGKNSETGSIHFMQFPATLVQLAEKTPPQQLNREKFLRLDLCISWNFLQLWFRWQVLNRWDLFPHEEFYPKWKTTCQVHVLVQINKMCVCCVLWFSLYCSLCWVLVTSTSGECTRAGLYIKGVQMCYEHGRAAGFAMAAALT